MHAPEEVMGELVGSWLFETHGRGTLRIQGAEDVIDRAILASSVKRLQHHELATAFSRHRAATASWPSSGDGDRARLRLPARSHDDPCNLGRYPSAAASCGASRGTCSHRTSRI